MPQILILTLLVNQMTSKCKGNSNKKSTQRAKFKI